MAHGSRRRARPTSGRGAFGRRVLARRAFGRRAFGRRAATLLITAGAAAGTAACGRPAERPGGATASGPGGTDTSREIPVLEEAFLTPRDTLANVDSPAVWHGPDGQHWLLATAKEGDVIRVSDAATGELLREASGEGTATGRLDRPNGIVVVDDILFVVERNNARVQAFTLPGFESVGTFGEEHLEYPYGIAVVEPTPGTYELYVTDNYELPGERIPPDSALGERVERFRVSVDGGRLRAERIGAFGDTSGLGVLHVVESIWADPEAGRLLIAEEEEGRSHLKVYTLEGEFTGDTVGARWFPHQAEGIVLYDCEDGGGYWLATDQGDEVNTFHVFDRATLGHVGSFRAAVTRNTDGIALTQVGFGPFPDGAFYAVHDDGNVAAFSWTAVAEALALRTDCTRPAPAARG